MYTFSHRRFGIWARVKWHTLSCLSRRCRRRAHTCSLDIIVWDFRWYSDFRSERFSVSVTSNLSYAWVNHTNAKTIRNIEQTTHSLSTNGTSTNLAPTPSTLSHCSLCMIFIYFFLLPPPTILIAAVSIPVRNTHIINVNFTKPDGRSRKKKNKELPMW